MNKAAKKKYSRKGSDGKPMRYVGIWIEDWLKKALCNMANKNNRSMTGEIRHRLESASPQK